MDNRLCKLLGTEKPIVSAPMGGAVGPELAAAVSNAGGFGTIPLWGGTTENVCAGIRNVRTLTDRNFAVNLNMDFEFADKLDVCIEEKVFAVSLFWGVLPDAIKTAKAGGLCVFQSVGNAKEAKIAADAGADVIVAQGWEAGGHVWGKVTTMALVPAVADAVSVPVVAAGGISDGRAMAAALMLGASGVWIGTRLLAAKEAIIHDVYREKVLAASEDETVWTHDLYNGFWPDAPHRTLVNSTLETWTAEGSARPGDRPSEGQVIGTKTGGEAVLRYEAHTPQTGTSGEVEAMSLWAGQGVAQVRGMASAAEIIDEVYSDALARISDVSASMHR